MRRSKQFWQAVVRGAFWLAFKTLRYVPWKPALAWGTAMGTLGYTVHPRGDSPRALLKQLRDNKIVAIVPDQKSEDVFVPFFGKLAGTVAGPAVLALKTGAAILPMFCPRRPDGTYETVFYPAIIPEPTGDTEADVKKIMAEITADIEDIVRKYPDQWLWLHDRWRIPPPERIPESLHAELLAAAR